jgi:hypothetical protein
MPVEKHLKKFQVLVLKKRVLIEALTSSQNFDELAILAKQQGFDLSPQQLRANAEVVVRQKRQELEESSRLDPTPNPSPSRNILARIFSRKTHFQNIWENEMCRLCYFVDDPDYDSFARMKEKGG